MEIPQHVQEKLKCSECYELLSCGPVYLLHKSGGSICGRCSQQSEDSSELLSCGPVYLLHETGGTICGRCSQQSEDSTKINDRTRNEPYEATASLLAFPCAFAARGCPEKVSFSLGRPPHELSCKFRPFICPIAPRGSCDWIGSWPQLKEHCDEKHKSNVLENKCNLPRPDLTASNLQTYLISAFSFLFLLHVKVCVASGKLFHSVRMFGDSKLVEKSSYSLEIEGNDSKVTRKGSVLPTELMVIQEPTASSISINSLLEMLDGKYNEAKFIINIQTSINYNCLNCSKNIAYVSESKFCEECAKQLLKCKFNEKSCSFVDVNSYKCGKHESCFCEYQTECFICEVNFVGGSFIEHLQSSNCRYKAIKSNINAVVRLTQSISNPNYILFSSNNIGTIICSYKLCNSNLVFYLYTSLPSFELKNYKCSIELTDPQTKHSKILTPQIEYNCHYDWNIHETLDNFPSWKNNGIDVKINIEKI